MYFSIKRRIPSIVSTFQTLGLTTLALLAVHSSAPSTFVGAQDLSPAAQITPPATPAPAPQVKKLPPVQQAPVATYAPAADLLPASTAGFVRIPSLTSFCDAFHETNIGKMLEEESLQPFIEQQKAQARSSLESIGNKVGLRPQDLFDITTGEIAVAWLPFPKDKRRPYSLCVIADVRGKAMQVANVTNQIDRDLIEGGATRKEIEHRGQTIRLYTPKPKPGQLKIDQIALTWDDTRVVAADRDTVIIELLDAIAGQPATSPLSGLDDYKVVLQRSSNAISAAIKSRNHVNSFEWFMRPFEMGRILRDLLNVDRGNQVDILKLLENQGFDVVKAAGGAGAMNTKDFDLLHRGFIFAPTAPGQIERFTKAANMLHFVNQPLEQIPSWVHKDVGTFFRLNWKMGQAFWAAETLVDEAFGSEMFRPMIKDIRDDEEGPQIDIERNVIPNFDDQLILLGDNVMPAGSDSERMLVAIRIKDAKAIAEAIRKAMEVEPDAAKLDILPGVDIWRVQRGDSDDEFDADVFGDLGFDEEIEEDEAPPLLDHWAIALVDKGPGSASPWLMFSSHPELLIETAKRIQLGNQDGLNSVDDIKLVFRALTSLGATQASIDRVARPAIALRSKYSLLREGKLKDSDSVMSNLLRRLFVTKDDNNADQIDTAKLPPLEKIEKYLRPAGGFFQTTNDGWMINGFLLK